MKLAIDFEIGSTIQLINNKSRKGIVLGNKMRDGDNVLAIEWNDGSLDKVRTNEIEPSLSIEEEFKLVQKQVNSKLEEASKLIREATDLALQNGKDLVPLDFYAERKFNTEQLESAIKYAGWSTSSWYC
jgi:hypothetical protein